MAVNKDSIERQLAELKAQFGERLALEIPELEQAVVELTHAGERWHEHAERLQLRFHTLAGSAGTFGHAQVGIKARELELLLRSFLGQTQLLSAVQLELIQRVFLQFKASREQASVRLRPDPALASFEKRQALIYLLERDVDTANHICLTLATFGYQVRWLAETSLLLQAMTEQEPDALIIDLECEPSQHSQMDMLATLQQGRTKPIPLFVVSSTSDFQHYLAAVRCGALGYFTKPLNTAAIESRLQRLFSVQSADPYRVLIVDDDGLLAQHYALVLSQAGLVAETVQQPHSILETLSRFQPDVILMDVNMPECTGPELAQLIRLQDEWLGVPIIYLSSETDSERQMAVLIKAGDDFLTKPISDNALVVTLFARAQRARHLTEAMTRDSLTGLLQHAHIKERLQMEINRIGRHARPLSVIMLDIDHFKSVNDRYGHLVGDQVITSLSNLLRQQLRKTDLIGRYGGEEFLIVMPDCPLAKAHKVIDQLRQAFARFPFITKDSRFFCTFSAGIAQAKGFEQADHVIAKADYGLYQAKAAGRDRVVLATQEDSSFSKN